MEELKVRPFTVHTFDLSMENPKTGNYLQANYYTVAGIEDEKGNLRQLSIGQLVMAICLEQAVQIEAQVVSMMSAIADTIVKMEVLTGIQEVIANKPDDNGNIYTGYPHTYDLSAWPNGNYGDSVDWNGVLDFFKAEGICTNINGESSAEEAMSALSTALDDLNTVNQEQMVELESMTNKRDQRYDLISNVLKSFNNVMTSIANNI